MPLAPPGALPTPDVSAPADLGDADSLLEESAYDDFELDDLSADHRGEAPAADVGPAEYEGFEDGFEEDGLEDDAEPDEEPAKAVTAPASLTRVSPHRRPARLALMSGPSTGAPPAWQEMRRSVASRQPIDVGEASLLAARFAVDFLSWDEDDPTLRAEVLREYLADPRAATLGWSGAGRQSVDCPLPGRTALIDGRLFVDVAVRVTTYERVCPRPDHDLHAGSRRSELPPRALGRANAPDPAVLGWRRVATFWDSIAPPISRDHSGRLVVDIRPLHDSDLSEPADPH